MTTSGSVNFEQSGSEIIKDALLLVSGIEDDEDPSDSQYAICNRHLNRMCKAWSAKGLKAWCKQEATLNLLSGSASYTIGPTGYLQINRPISVENPRRYIDSVETQIRIESRNIYMNQPAKDTQGKPIFVFYDPTLDDGTLYVWPTPDSSSDSIKFTYKSYIEDFDSITDTPYFPIEWGEALVYGLAMRIMPMYKVTEPDASRIQGMAMQFLMDAENNDEEEGSVYLTPESYR
jgi:hypothetical protein